MKSRGPARGGTPGEKGPAQIEDAVARLQKVGGILQANVSLTKFNVQGFNFNGVVGDERLELPTSSV